MTPCRYKNYYCLSLIFILLIYNGYSLGQPNYNLDSLITSTKRQESSIDKIRNLLLIANEYKKTNPTEAIEILDSVLKISHQLRYPEGEADALIEKIALYRNTGNLDTSILYGEKAIKLCDSLHDLKRLAESYLNYGSSIRLKGETENAYQYYKKGLSLHSQIGDSSGIAQSYNKLGIIYDVKGSLDSATYYYQESIKIYKRIGEEAGIGAAMINLGKLYLTLGDIKLSKKYFLESIDYSKRYKKLQHIALALANLGMIAYDEKKFDQSIEYYNKSLEISIQVQDLGGMANLYNNIGNIYFEQEKDYNKAYEYYNKALAIFREMDQKNGLLINLMNIAVIYENWKDFEKALIINDTCLQIAKEIEDLNSQQIIYRNILAVYKQTGNYKLAFEYQCKYYEIYDSIFNLEKSKIITDLTLKYDKEKDQAKILTLENTNLQKDLSLRKRTNQKNIIFFIGLGLLLTAVFIIIFYHQKARKDNIISEQRIKQLEEEKKLLAAHFIVNGQEEERKRIAKELHDGLGVLLSTAKMQFSSIKDKSPENKPLIEKATKLLEQATGDVRRISHNMMPGLLTKFGFFEAVEDLFENLNETEGLIAEVKIEGETIRLPGNKEIMLYRIVQEMVNNTLKHAEAKNIKLDMEIQPNNLKIKYLDNGKGFNLVEKLESKSIGLTSIQSRVKFISGEIDVKSKSGEGVIYEISVPLP